MSILNKHHVIEFARIVDELDIPVMAFGLRMILEMNYLKAQSIYFYMQTN